MQRVGGAPIHSSFWPAKLRWIGEQRPGIWERTSYWLSPSDYLAHEFFGTYATTIPMASGTGLLDRKALAWDLALAGHVGVSAAQLPVIERGPLIGLTPKYQQLWPRLASIPWLLAAGDGACSTIGAATATRDWITLMLGTSGSLRVIPDQPTASGAHRALWCYRIDDKRDLAGVALSNVGNVISWAKEVLRLPGDVDTVSCDISAPDDPGLVAYPLLAGERGPDWLDNASGIMMGLDIAHSASDLYRALIHGVALQIGLGYESLASAGYGSRQIVVTGGCRTNRPLVQSIADTVGRELRVSPVAEASTRGAAILAAEAAGIEVLMRGCATGTDEVVLPRSSGAARAHNYRARQLALLRAARTAEPLSG